MNYYIGDWHYGHANIIDIDDRPFENVESMNQALVRNWQDAVTDKDLVYVLGDMFWSPEEKAADVLQALPGRKILVKGNHDKATNPRFRAQFELVDDYLEVEDRGRHVVLCHYPIPCFRNHYYGWWHLYAHVHRSFEANMTEHHKSVMEALYDKPHLMYNTGAMMPYMGYTPRTLDEIAAGANMA